MSFAIIIGLPFDSLYAESSTSIREVLFVWSLSAFRMIEGTIEETIPIIPLSSVGIILVIDFGSGG